MADFTTSKRVNLYDQRSDTVLLHPATELSVVDCTSGGIVQIDGNSIWVDPADSGLSGLYALKNEVGSLAYTSLTEAAVNGGTHTIYGGTVTGTGIITSRIDVTPSIRSVDSATNDKIPTEHAVAFELATKQDYLISGAGIIIYADANNRSNISANLTQTIEPLATASTEKIPSESATRYALDSAVNAITVTMSSYATSAWCLNTFAQKGEGGSGGGDVPYAGYEVAGKVMPIQNQGLVLGDFGSMTVQSAGVYPTFASAAAQPHGAVRVLGVVDSSGTYANTAYVPHTNAVVTYVAGQLGSYVKKTDLATANSSGIVVIKSGLSVTNGSVSLAAATTASIGGVSLTNTMAGTEIGATLPTGAAISGYMDGRLASYQPATVFTSGLTSAGGSVTLNQATTASIGGVIVTPGEAGGIAVNNGSISLSAARYVDGTSTTSSAGTPIALGGIRVYSRGGLLLGDNGVLRVNSAQYVTGSDTTSSGTVYQPVGGVRVWKDGGLQLGSRATLRLVEAGYVRTSGGSVSSATGDTTDTVIPLGGVRVWSSGGIALTSGVIRLQSAAYVSGSAGTSSGAAYVPFGGVRVVSDAGLQTASGNIWLQEGTVYSTYDSAINSGHVGGVRVLNKLIAADSAYWTSDYAVVPSVDAAYKALDSATAYRGDFEITEDTSSPNHANWKYIVTEGRIYDDSTGTSAVLTPSPSSISMAGVSNVWLNVVSNNGTITAALNSAYVNNDSTFSYLLQQTVTSGGTGYKERVTTGPIVLRRGNGGGGTTVASYTGPFAVTQVTSATDYVTANVSGGYVKWLDGDSWVGSSATAGGAFTISKATATQTGWTGVSSSLYLTGSSGFVEGATITETAFIISGGNQGYTYDGSLESGRGLWVNSSDESISCWLDSGTIPYNGTIMYAQPTGDTSVGTVSASVNTIVVGGVTYTQESLTPTANGYVWTNGAAKVYTSKALPGYYTKTMPMVSSGFSFTVTDTGLPPSGRFYTKLAENQNGTLIQQQYGTVWHEHWGDDYKGQFAIGRVTIDQAAADAAETDSYPYRYIVNGGTVYGGIDFNTGGIIDGVVADGGVVLSPAAFQYPKNTGVLAAGRDDGLFFPYNPYANYSVWLNIWKGPWASEYSGKETDTRDIWRFVIDSQCLEGQIDNVYSINIGWITGNGAPQQDHKGAISIRGRWA